MTLIYRILTAVYCLPLHQLAFFVIMACGIFRELRANHGRRIWWKLLILAGLAASICLIALETFWGRSVGSEPAPPILTPFHTYRAYLAEPFEEILRMNFMNTILFLPAGMFLCELFPRKCPRWVLIPLTVLLLGIFSAGIEYCQYAYALGQAEIDDVIHNVLGSFLGALVIPTKHSTGLHNIYLAFNNQ